MRQDESDKANGPRPTASEIYMMVVMRIMQGFAALMAIAFCMIELSLIPEIVGRSAYVELTPLLGFGVIYLGACAGMWMGAAAMLKKIRVQLADPNRTP